MKQSNQITLAVFDAAAAVDQDAIDAILDYYKDDIDALCTKQTRKRNGVMVSHVDEDMRHEVKRRLIADLPNLAEKMRWWNGQRSMRKNKKYRRVPHDNGTV